MMTNRAVTVRRATVEDVPALQRMAAAFAASDVYPAGSLPAPPPCDIEAFVRFDLGVVFVLEESGQVAGMLAARVLESGAARIADELVLWVEPAYRHGRGAFRLAREFEAWARGPAAGCGWMKMVAPASNPKVGAFYASLGLTPIETHYLKRLD
jgi:GNAT superfamily N-acetyltransferase